MNALAERLFLQEHTSLCAIFLAVRVNLTLLQCQREIVFGLFVFFLPKLILFCSISSKVRLKIHLELQHSKQLDKQGVSSSEG